MNSFWPTWKENAFFATLIAVLTLGLIVFVGVKSWNAVAEHEAIGREPLARNTIVIAGEGKVTGQPTLAQVDVGVYSEAKDVPTAQNENTQKINAMLDGIKGLGIASGDIQTNNYNIYPKFDYTNGQQNLTGYTVTQNVTVKVRDLSKVGAVLSKAVDLGANQVNGVSFSIDDPTSLKKEARKKALEDAQAKAKELADALGVRVVRVVGFSESPMNQPGPIPFAADALGKGGGGGSVPQIQSGSLDVISDVSVTFEIQ